MSFLSILGTVVTIILVCLGALFVFTGLQFLSFFHWRKCKYCNHNMEYKGLKNNEKDSHYLFHCSKCGAWEQVPVEELFEHLESSPQETEQ